MIEYRDDCVGCGLPCTPVCRYHEKVPYYSCDECGDDLEPEELYIGPVSGRELCAECVLKELEKPYK